MATTTSPIDHAGHHEATVTTTPKTGFFVRALERFMQARMRHAEIQVQAYLARLSDERLSDLGFTSDETKALREKGRIPASYWG